MWLLTLFLPINVRRRDEFEQISPFASNTLIPPPRLIPRGLSNIKVVTIFFGSKNGKYRIKIWVVIKQRDKKIADKAIKILGWDVQIPRKKYYVFRISNLARILEYPLSPVVCFIICGYIADRIYNILNQINIK